MRDEANFSANPTPKKRKFYIHFLASLQKFPKQLWKIMGFSRLCDDYGKQAKKQGDQEWSPNFMGFFGGK